MEEGSLFSHFASVLSFSSFLKNFHIKRDLHDVVIFKSSFEPCLGVEKLFIFFSFSSLFLAYPRSPITRPIAKRPNPPFTRCNPTSFRDCPEYTAITKVATPYTPIQSKNAT